MTKQESTTLTREIVQELIKAWESKYCEPQQYEPQMQIGSPGSIAEDSHDGKPP